MPPPPPTPVPGCACRCGCVWFRCAGPGGPAARAASGSPDSPALESSPPPLLLVPHVVKFRAGESLGPLSFRVPRCLGLRLSAYEDVRFPTATRTQVVWPSWSTARGHTAATCPAAGAANLGAWLGCCRDRVLRRAAGLTPRWHRWGGTLSSTNRQGLGREVTAGQWQARPGICPHTRHLCVH